MADFMQKFWWKNLMHKVQSWGASVVLVGALFKITHMAGATFMLFVGLLTEALIFFLAGIEKPHEEIDWTLVYPELKLSDDIEDEILSSKNKSKGVSGAGTGLAAPQTDAINKFNEMLDKAGEDGLFDKLHSGLSNLNDNVAKLHDITDASVATTEFAENMKSASSNVNELSESVKQSAQSLTYSSDGLTDAFNKTQETVSSHKEELDNAYQNLVSSMDLDFSSLAEGNKEYNESISGLNKNLSAINAIFEMQLGDADLEGMVKDVQESAVYAKKYSEEITKLSRNLGALNKVYGNMLTAMNVQAD